jgi:hypothetical protein
MQDLGGYKIICHYGGDVLCYAYAARISVSVSVSVSIMQKSSIAVRFGTLPKSVPIEERSYASCISKHDGQGPSLDCIFIAL